MSIQISNVTNTNYVFGGNLTPGLSIAAPLGNKDLTWEISSQTDFGLEMNLLRNRLTFSYDYYKKTTVGMLFLTPLRSLQVYPPSGRGDQASASGTPLPEHLDRPSHVLPFQAFERHPKVEGKGLCEVGAGVRVNPHPQ